MGMGPLEFLVLAFPGERLGGDVVHALDRLRQSGDIRVIDSIVVTTSATGAVRTAEIADIEELRAALTGPATAETALIAVEDAEEVGASLGPDTTALVLLVEHTWARDAAAVIRQSGGWLAASVRIPPEHAEQALLAAVGTGR